MALTKRRSIWYVDLVHPASGKRFRQSTRTSSRALAKEYHDRLQAELWGQSKLGAKVQHSFDEACLRYLEEKGHLRSIAEVARHIRFWRQDFASRPLEYITRDRVEEMIRTLSGSAANKNRHLSTLRCILRLAEGDGIGSIGHLP